MAGGVGVRCRRARSAQHRALQRALAHVVPTICFPGDPDTPDALFPNNVFATAHGPLHRRPHAPSGAPARSRARRHPRASSRGVLGYAEIDLSDAAGHPCELTGALVIDRARGIGCCGLSERCDEAGARLMHDAFGLRATLAVRPRAGRIPHQRRAQRCWPGAPRWCVRAVSPTRRWSTRSPRCTRRTRSCCRPAEHAAFAGNASRCRTTVVWMSAGAGAALSPAQRGRRWRVPDSSVRAGRAGCDREGRRLAALLRRRDLLSGQQVVQKRVQVHERNSLREEKVQTDSLPRFKEWPISASHEPAPHVQRCRSAPCRTALRPVAARWCDACVAWAQPRRRRRPPPQRRRAAAAARAPAAERDAAACPNRCAASSADRRRGAQRRADAARRPRGESVKVSTADGRVRVYGTIRTGRARGRARTAGKGAGQAAVHVRRRRRPRTTEPNRPRPASSQGVTCASCWSKTKPRCAKPSPRA